MNLVNVNKYNVIPLSANLACQSTINADQCNKCIINVAMASANNDGVTVAWRQSASACGGQERNETSACVSIWRNVISVSMAMKKRKRKKKKEKRKIAIMAMDEMSSMWQASMRA